MSKKVELHFDDANENWLAKHRKEQKAKKTKGKAKAKKASASRVLARYLGVS